MYFWNIEKLKKDIKELRLTERDRFLYGFIYIVLDSIGIETNGLIPHENPNKFDFLVSAIVVFAVTCGTIVAYKANGGKEGCDFWGRYFSIGFIITLRILTLFLPLSIMSLLLYCAAFDCNIAERSTGYLDIIFNIFFNTVLYWRIYVHIKQLNA